MWSNSKNTGDSTRNEERTRAVRHIFSFLSSKSHSDTCNRGLLDDTIKCLKNFYNTVMNNNNLPMKKSIISNINNNSLHYIIYPGAGASSYVLSQTTTANYKF